MPTTKTLMSILKPHYFPRRHRGLVFERRAPIHGRHRRRAVHYRRFPPAQLEHLSRNGRGETETVSLLRFVCLCPIQSPFRNRY